MMTFFITMFTALLIFLGGALGLYHGLTYEEDILMDDGHTEESTNTETPTGIPGQSAPQEAIQVCIDKKAEDSCTFVLAGRNLEGICSPSAEELACTPILPE